MDKFQTAIDALKAIAACMCQCGPGDAGLHDCESCLAKAVLKAIQVQTQDHPTFPNEEDFLRWRNLFFLEFNRSPTSLETYFHIKEALKCTK